MTYTTWYNGDGCYTTIPGEDIPKFANGDPQEKINILIRTFEASSNEEAYDLHDKFMDDLYKVKTKPKSSVPILFLDDEKDPKWYHITGDIRWAKNIDDAIEIIKDLKDTPFIIYLDHDLGDKHRDGSTFLAHLLEMKWPVQKVVCISWNPAGVQRMMWVCKDHDIPFERGTF